MEFDNYVKVVSAEVEDLANTVNKKLGELWSNLFCFCIIELVYREITNDTYWTF